MELLFKNCSGDPFSCGVETEEEEALRVALGRCALGNTKRGARLEEWKKNGLILVVGEEVEGESERNEDEEETIEIEVSTIFVLLCYANTHRERESFDNQKIRIWFSSHRILTLVRSVIAITTYHSPLVRFDKFG